MICFILTVGVFLIISVSLLTVDIFLIINV